jgi:hypothetical protein
MVITHYGSLQEWVSDTRRSLEIQGYCCQVSTWCFGVLLCFNTNHCAIYLATLTSRSMAAESGYQKLTLNLVQWRPSLNLGPRVRLPWSPRPTPLVPASDSATHLGLMSCSRGMAEVRKVQRKRTVSWERGWVIQSNRHSFSAAKMGLLGVARRGGYAEGWPSLWE